MAEVTDAAREPGEEGKLIVQVEDTLIGKQRRLPVDMVILIGRPRAAPRHASRWRLRFGISCTMDGFFIERHPKLDPVATMTDGIFIAGTCQGPKDIPDSVAQGAAAAARVQGMITKGTVMVEPVRGLDRRRALLGLPHLQHPVPVQRHQLPTPRPASAASTRALCKGCGTCVAACPARAITGAHFNDDQLVAEIEGMLWDALPQRELPR